MRQLAAFIAFAIVLPLLAADPASTIKYEISGIALHTKECEKAIKGILEKDKGVSNVVFDQKKRTVSFDVTSHKTGATAIGALKEGGLHGEITLGPPDRGVTSAFRFVGVIAGGGGKDEVKTIKMLGVAVPDEACKAVIKNLFPDAKVEFVGTGLQKDLSITGKNLYPSNVLLALNKAGFGGEDDLPVEQKVGAGIYCKDSEEAVIKALGKVKGVSKVSCDRKTRTVTYTARNHNRALQAGRALNEAGFSDVSKGAIVGGGKGVACKEVTVRDVFAGSEECRKSIADAFKGNNVAFQGKNAQRDVVITGDGLDKNGVGWTLDGIGFHGTIDRQVEIKGVGLYGPEAVQAVKDGLAKLDGITNVTCDSKTRTVTATAREMGEAMWIPRALLSIGFIGITTIDGEPIARLYFQRDDVPVQAIVKVMPIRGIHVGSEECKAKIAEALKGVKLSYSGTGLQKDMVLTSDKLDRKEVMKKLNDLGLHGSTDSYAELGGLGLYCDESAKTVKELLSKLDGISDVAVDVKGRRTTFKLMKSELHSNAEEALAKAGFHINKTIVEDGVLDGFGRGGWERAGFAEEPVKEVTVKGVHVGCDTCEKVIGDLFKGNKVTFSGKGPQKDVKITGEKLLKNTVRKSLNNAGFGGTFE